MNANQTSMRKAGDHGSRRGARGYAGWALVMGALTLLTAMPTAVLANDPYEPNDTLADAHFLGGPLRNPATDGVQVFGLDDAVLGPVDDKDFFAFTAFAGVPIAIRVEPLAVDGHPIGARDLGLRFWRRVSAQTGEFSLLAQINFNGPGQGEYHPPIVYNLAGFMVAEVFSTDGLNASQPYRLTISNAAIDPTPQGDPELMVTHELEIVEDGDTVSFGQVEIGQSVGIGLTLRNLGDAPLTFQGQPVVQGPAAADFLLGNLPAQIAPGSLQVLGMSFFPSAAGQRVAVVTLPSNDPDHPDFSFIVNGTGVALPEMQILIDEVIIDGNGEFDFGHVEIGSTETVSLRIRNTGNGQLDITNMAISGAGAADFSTNLLNASLAPGGAVTGSLSFSPTQAGSQAAVLVISNNAGPYSVELQGRGYVDCNGNGIPDDLDIANGFSRDCNGNGIPDECEPDSNGNGIPDDCEQPEEPVNGDDGEEADADSADDHEENALEDEQNQDIVEQDQFADDDDQQIDGDDGYLDDIEEDVFDEELDDGFTPVRVGGFCGTGVAMNMPMMMLALLFTGAGRRLLGRRGGTRYPTP